VLKSKIQTASKISSQCRHNSKYNGGIKDSIFYYSADYKSACREFELTSINKLRFFHLVFKGIATRRPRRFRSVRDYLYRRDRRYGRVRGSGRMPCQNLRRFRQQLHLQLSRQLTSRRWTGFYSPQFAQRYEWPAPAGARMPVGL
jgi:hypothetical protein